MEFSITFTVILIVCWIKINECKFEPQVAFYCGKPSLVMRQDGWTEDHSQQCIDNDEEIVEYCKKSYPNLKIVNAEPATTKLIINRWCNYEQTSCDFHKQIRPFKCLDDDFKSDQLRLPKDCEFGHFTNVNECKNHKLLKMDARNACKKKNMRVDSFGMTFSCEKGAMEFHGVEFVCCPREANHNPSDSASIRHFLQTAVLTSEKEEQFNYEKQEKQLVESEKVKLDEAFQQIKKNQQSNDVKLSRDNTNKYYKSLINQFQDNKLQLMTYHIDRVNYIFNTKLASLDKQLTIALLANDFSESYHYLTELLDLFYSRKHDLIFAIKHCREMNLPQLIHNIQNLKKYIKKHRQDLIKLLDNNVQLKGQLLPIMDHYIPKLNTDHLDSYKVIKDHFKKLSQLFKDKEQNVTDNTLRKTMENRIPGGGSILSNEKEEQKNFENEEKNLLQSEMERLQFLVRKFYSHLSKITHTKDEVNDKKHQKIVKEFKQSYQGLLNQFQQNKQQLMMFHIERINFIFNTQFEALSKQFEQSFVENQNYKKSLKNLKVLLNLFRTRKHDLKEEIKHARHMGLFSLIPILQDYSSKVPKLLANTLAIMDKNEVLKRKLMAAIDEYQPIISEDHLREYDYIKSNIKPVDEFIDKLTRNGDVHYNLGLDDRDQKNHHWYGENELDKRYTMDHIHIQPFAKPLLWIGLATSLVIIGLVIFFVTMVNCHRNRHQSTVDNGGPFKGKRTPSGYYQRFPSTNSSNPDSTDDINLPKGFGFLDIGSNKSTPTLNSYENPTYNILARAGVVNSVTVGNNCDMATVHSNSTIDEDEPPIID